MQTTPIDLSNKYTTNINHIDTKTDIIHHSLYKTQQNYTKMIK